MRVPVSAKTTEDADTAGLERTKHCCGAPDLIGKGKVDISETLRTGKSDGELFLLVGRVVIHICHRLA